MTITEALTECNEDFVVLVQTMDGENYPINGLSFEDGTLMLFTEKANDSGYTVCDLFDYLVSRIEETRKRLKEEYGEDNDEQEHEDEDFDVDKYEQELLGDVKECFFFTGKTVTKLKDLGIEQSGNHIVLLADHPSMDYRFIF